MTREKKRFYRHKVSGVDIDQSRKLIELWMLIWESGNIKQFIKKGNYALCLNELQKQKNDPKWIGGELKIIPFG